MEFVIFDTETTGLLKPDNAPLAEQPQIIEFYGVRINQDFEILEELELFINPGVPLTKEITCITGIKDKDLVHALPFGDVAQPIFNLFDGADLAVAHNIAFDNGMLANEFSRIGISPPKAKHDMCTVEEYKRKYGRRISLGALYKKLYGKHFVAHRAKNDVFALVSVFHKLIDDGVIDLAFLEN